MRPARHTTAALSYPGKLPATPGTTDPDNRPGLDSDRPPLDASLS